MRGPRKATAHGGIEAWLVVGADELEVVGESFYQDELWSIVGPTADPVRQDIVAVLIAEPENEYDGNAIAVWIHGHKVGHLSRDDAATHLPGLLELQRRVARPIALNGVVVGGGPRADRRIGYLGVWLEYDRREFGLKSAESAQQPEPARLRTGLSEAVSSDLEDDSYDLGWLERLPENPAQRLVELRKLLDDEVQPISRHYLMCELEAELYAFRDTFPTALEEYDSVAELHDSEMTTIRPALFEKFGRVPLLETYKQACIRQSKAKNLAKALWWAERGLEIYGDDAHEPAWIADLQKRVAKLEMRISQASSG